VEDPTGSSLPLSVSSVRKLVPQRKPTVGDRMHSRARPQIRATRAAS
jgi:hypothetical protein